jgi:NAD(P)-dependent dehydrogenase (short-subunit alcohol dehydrogenase family)
MSFRTSAEVSDMARADLAGRTAVVTGAGGGIGRAMALRAADNGMALALCDLAAEGLAETRALAEARGAGVVSAVLDVRDAGALADFAGEAPGPVALVFANAGLLRTGALASQPAAELQLMFEVNVMGVMNTVQAFLPRLKAQVGPSRLVITGSQASFAPFANLGGYCATKHALLAMAEALQLELEADGGAVRVSFLAPGSVATAIYGEASSPNAAHSISADRAAEIAFAGIAANRFLISTHADLADKLAARFADLREALA